MRLPRLVPSLAMTRNCIELPTKKRLSKESLIVSKRYLITQLYQLNQER